MSTDTDGSVYCDEYFSEDSKQRIARIWNELHEANKNRSLIWRQIHETGTELSAHYYKLQRFLLDSAAPQDKGELIKKHNAANGMPREMLRQAITAFKEKCNDASITVREVVAGQDDTNDTSDEAERKPNEPTGTEGTETWMSRRKVKKRQKKVAKKKAVKYIQNLKVKIPGSFDDGDEEEW